MFPVFYREHASESQYSYSTGVEVEVMRAPNGMMCLTRFRAAKLTYFFPEV
jgi:hypothetical protein